MAFGAILGFLELLMFQGELGSQYAAATITNIKSIIHHASDAQVQFQELLWKSFVSKPQIEISLSYLLHRVYIMTNILMYKGHLVSIGYFSSTLNSLSGMSA